MGVPPNHPFIDRFSKKKPSIWGYLHLWKPQYVVLYIGWGFVSSLTWMARPRRPPSGQGHCMVICVMQSPTKPWRLADVQTQGFSSTFDTWVVVDCGEKSSVPFHYIPQYCGWKKSCTPLFQGLKHVETIQGGAGFCPSLNIIPTIINQKRRGQKILCAKT